MSSRKKAPAANGSGIHQFSKTCPYCNGQVLVAITLNPQGGTFGLSHGATACPMVDAVRTEVHRGGDFDPTVLMRVSGLA